MNETPKTKLTIDDLVEAQRETARSLKTIEEHLDAIARHEKTSPSSSYAVLIFICGCVLAVVGEFFQDAAKHRTIQDAAILKRELQPHEISERFPLLVPFVAVVIGYHVVRYMNSGSSYSQKRDIIAMLEQRKKAAADQTPPTSSW